jgi:negative regulator of flagellin synthesis FlgM
MTKSVKTTNAISKTDAVQISRVGQDYQIAKQAVAQSADVREGKVAQLKARVDSGEYQVEPGDFASKLIEKYTANL